MDTFQTETGEDLLLHGFAAPFMQMPADGRTILFARGAFDAHAARGWRGATLRAEHDECAIPLAEVADGSLEVMLSDRGLWFTARMRPQPTALAYLNAAASGHLGASIKWRPIRSSAPVVDVADLVHVGLTFEAAFAATRVWRSDATWREMDEVTAEHRAYFDRYIAPVAGAGRRSPAPAPRASIHASARRPAPRLLPDEWLAEQARLAAHACRLLEPR